MPIKYYTAQEINKGVSRKDLGKKNFRKQCKGCFDFIEELCKAANMDMMTAFLGITLFQRFAVQQSIMLTDRYLVAAAALFLAAKVTEKPRSLSYFVSKLIKKRLKPEEARTILTPNPDGQFAHPVYKQVQENLLLLEHQMLCLLGFDVLNTPSPYTCKPYIWAKVPFLVQLEQQEKTGELVKPPHIGGSFSARQIAYNCVNDSLRMGLCIQYTAEDICLAGIDAMLTLLEVPTRPEGAPWWAGSEWDTGDARTALVTSIREEIIKCYVLPGRAEASAAASAATRNKTEALEALTGNDTAGADGTREPVTTVGADAAGSGGGSVLGKRPRPEEHEATADTNDAPPAKAAKSSAAPSPDELTVYPMPMVDDTSAAGVMDGAVDAVKVEGIESGGMQPFGDREAVKVAMESTVNTVVNAAVNTVGNGSHAVDDDRESGELEAGEIPQ